MVKELWRYFESPSGALCRKRKNSNVNTDGLTRIWGVSLCNTTHASFKICMLVQNFSMIATELVRYLDSLILVHLQYLSRQGPFGTTPRRLNMTKKGTDSYQLLLYMYIQGPNNSDNGNE